MVAVDAFTREKITTRICAEYNQSMGIKETISCVLNEVQKVFESEAITYSLDDTNREKSMFLSNMRLAESEPVVGSNFYFNAIFEVNQYTDSSQFQLDPNIVNTPHPSKSIRVLLIEDDYVSQMVMKGIMESKNCILQIASSGREGLQLFHENEFDIVLMDIQMPDLNGYDTAKYIRRLEAGNSHTPILATTAYALKGDREKCLECGMDDYITKPIDCGTLFDKMKTLLKAK